MAIDQILGLGPVVPVLVIEHIEDARPLAEALVAGGLRALEVTLRTDAALEAIRVMSTVEGAVVGAGTILCEDQLDAALAAGAKFIVSPGLTERLAKAAQARNVPFLPGVADASDIMRGIELGLARFKFFPAEASGGAEAVRAFAGPFPDIAFCPTGGISPEIAPSYLALPNVRCVGGSWLCPEEAVRRGDWPHITKLAQAAARPERV
jgi:2-dehydro-3-deoxyphosphogluconate aldolase/(4S)-4-hydroxy-2-oxoglutarate aldolase